MKNITTPFNCLLVFSLLLICTSFGWTNYVIGSVYSGNAVSKNSGKKWQVNLKITYYNESSGFVEGEMEWPSLNSVHKIEGKLTDSKFTFKEVAYIKKGKANLNCQYISTLKDDKISGTWTDPNSDTGTIILTLVDDNDPSEPVYSLVGTIYTGNAVSKKSGKSWKVTLKITSFNESSGFVEGEMEWPSLNSVHKIEGKLTDSKFTFKEVAYIKKGKANLNCQYISTLKDDKISGTWTDPNSDTGTIILTLVDDNDPSEPVYSLVGTIYTGNAVSKKSGKSWKVTLKITSFNESSGFVEGEMEWPSLNSVHKIEGKLTDSKFTFKEVAYIKKGKANLNCQYISTLKDDKISGTWTDPNSDTGTIILTLVDDNDPSEPVYSLVGTIYTGNAVSKKSGKSWKVTLKITSFNESSGFVEGEMEWPSLNSVHKIEGKLTDSKFTFKEVAYIKKGKANLNCQYTTNLKNNMISGTWTDPGSDRGTIELKKK